jgi:predicted HicB family RNase H-like nuclease
MGSLGDHDQGVEHRTVTRLPAWGHWIELRLQHLFPRRTLAEWRCEFAVAVDDYLRDCKKQGLSPEKPASGRLLLRVPPKVNSRALVAAQSKVKSLNLWATEALQPAVAEG